MNFKDFNISMLNYNYDTAYAFLSVATRLSDLPDSNTFTTNHVKFGVYAQTFPVQGREKYTGFEFVGDLDKLARQKISESNILNKKHDGMNYIENQINHIQSETYQVKLNLKIFEQNHNIKSLTDAVEVYRQHLIDNARKHQGQPNVLYFSGGADSEMILWSFMEAEVDFVPVTFVYKDNSGNILNYHDTTWADEFCQTHDLPHVKREINVEEFWQSPELIVYAQVAQTLSPHIATYHKMVDLVHEEINDIGFEKFAGRAFRKLGKIGIPNFPEVTGSDDFIEVAPDIWSFKMLTPDQCQNILDIITLAQFSPQTGDPIPVEELVLEEYDQVFYQGLVKYLQNTVGKFYFETYKNAYFDVLSAWFDRLGADVTTTDIESDAIRLHHNKSRISMSLVLNSDFHGGEITFPRQNFTNKHIPCGTLLMWPGQITHPHCVMPVTSGTRYSINIYTKLETFSTREHQLNYKNTDI